MNEFQRNIAFKDAIIAGVSTFFVDGIIKYFSLRGKTSIAVSVDSITNTADTVLGSSVVLAIILAVILTIINYLKIKSNKVPFYPNVIWLIIKHTFFTFGVVTALSVLWQRYMGTVYVGVLPAVLIIGLIAGTVSGVINYLTIRSCLVFENEQP